MKPIGQNSKTLYSTIQANMIDEIYAFHNKGNIFIDEHFRNHIIPHAVRLDQLQQLEKSDYEILPFHDEDISCVSEFISSIRRSRSAQKFANNKIEISTIKKLLQNSFNNAADGSRPYPSGGALYPIEIMCVVFEERLEGQEVLASGFYHYRPSLNVLQPLKAMSSKKLYSTLYQMELSETANPAFSFIYVGNIAKMLVKYRFRGYRYALMETGAMFQQADLVAKELGLINKLYSGFNDHELTHLLGLDKLNFLPLLIQSFGEAL